MPVTVSGAAGSPAAAAGVPVAEAARRVGVSASTLRSWERRYQLGPTGRTAGGHRRYTAGDIAALQRLRRLAETGLAVGSAAEQARRSRVAAPPPPSRSLPSFDDAVSTLDPAAIRAASERALSRLGPAQAWSSVFVPTLQRLGDEWDCAPDGILREHLVASALLDVLDRYAARCRDRRPRLLAVAAPGEGHTLPLHALRAALAAEEHGLQVFDAAPPQSIAAAAAALEPGAVLVWAQVPGTADLALLRSLNRHAPAVYAGGPGWPARRLPSGVVRPGDLTAAVDAMLAWVA